MSRSVFTLENFQAQILSKSLARTNRFEVIITPPTGLRQNSYFNSLGVSLMAEQASLPMLNIATKPFKIFGPSYQRPITSEYGGEGMSINFHIDRDMKLKKFFDAWMHRVIDPVAFTVGYQNDYIGTVEIHQLDEANNVTYAVLLEEAFPRNMNLVDLNHSSSNQTHRLNVLFAYRKWSELLTTQTGPIDVPRVVQNPQVPTEDFRPPGPSLLTRKPPNVTADPGKPYLPPSA